MRVGGRYHDCKEAEGGMVAPARARCMEEVAHVVEKKAVASTGRNKEERAREMIVQEDLRQSVSFILFTVDATPSRSG